MNVALVVPAAIMTLAGTVAAGFPLVSVTAAPSDGAAAVSVTVPVTVAPPATEFVDNNTLDSAAVTEVGAVVELDDPHAATDAHAASTRPRRTQLYRQCMFMAFRFFPRDERVRLQSKGGAMRVLRDAARIDEVSVF